MRDIINCFQFKDWRESFFNISICFFVGTLPLFLNLNTIALWCLVVSSLLTIKSHNGIFNLKQNVKGLVPVYTLFLLFVLGLLLSKNTGRGYSDLVRAIPLFLIPTVIFMNSKKDFNKKTVFIALGVGLGVAMIICWFAIGASILSKSDPLKQATYIFEYIYTDKNLVIPLDGHPSYFAVLLVIFISALLFDNSFKHFRKNKIVLTAILIPCIIFLIQTSSRIGVIALLTIIVYYAIKKINLKSILSVIALVSIVVVLSLKFDYLSLKFDKIVNSKGQITEERFGRWGEILNVFIEKDSRLIYRRAYYNGGYDLALKENYNAHNQYLEFFVSNGIIGLFVFLYVLFLFVKQTKLKENALHFFVIFTLFSLTETFMGRSQGVMVFSFFYAFLIVYYTPVKPLIYDEK